jgi:outer membrane beta-barrel protein
MMTAARRRASRQGATRSFAALVSLALPLVSASEGWAELTDSPAAVKAAAAHEAAEAPAETPAETAAGAASDNADADACIDENVKADLFAKRKRRDVRDRLFQQTNRHEFTVLGGYYISDLFDGTYVVGGAYAYHMTEDFAVEAHGAVTHIRSQSEIALEQNFSVLAGKPRRELLFHADLVWDPAHGKLRLGGAIQHFDLYVAAGAGVVDSVLSSDIAGNAAIGLKFFLGRAMALRVDVRSYVYRQQLLAKKEWVNDVTATLGFSVFLPVSE